jgi:hypothetical protein
LKNLRTTTSMFLTTSFLKGLMFLIVCLSIQMIFPLKIKWMVWPMPESPLWTFYKSWPILGMTSHPWLKSGFDIPLSIQFSLGLVSSLLGTTNAPKWCAPKSRGETHLRVSQSQVAKIVT